MASPIPLPAYFLLGGQRSPGIARVSGGTVPREWQEQKGSGTDGNSLRYMGAPLSKFKIAIELTTIAHVEAWKAFKPLVDKPKPGTQPPAYDIVHPLVQDIEIVKVVVNDRTMLQETEPGRWVTEIEFQSYKKPKPVVVSKPKSVDNAEGEPEQPESALERAIREQEAENAALRKEVDG